MRPFLFLCFAFPSFSALAQTQVASVTNNQCDFYVRAKNRKWKKIRGSLFKVGTKAKGKIAGDGKTFLFKVAARPKLVFRTNYQCAFSSAESNFASAESASQMMSGDGSAATSSSSNRLLFGVQGGASFPGPAFLGGAHVDFPIAALWSAGAIVNVSIEGESEGFAGSTSIVIMPNVKWNLGDAFYVGAEAGISLISFGDSSIESITGFGGGFLAEYRFDLGGVMLTPRGHFDLFVASGLTSTSFVFELALSF